MLFDPRAILSAPYFLLVMLAIILVAKPLTAWAIVWGLRYSFTSAVTVAIALAQVGEFSFLLADEAIRHELLSGEARSVLIASAIVSISLNPLLFRTIRPIERWLRGRPRLWRAVSRRAETGGAEINKQMAERFAAPAGDRGAAGVNKAVIVGYGPVGQTAARILRSFDIEPIVIDLNLDTVRRLAADGRLAIYGDATRREILEAAGIGEAKYLLVTIPDFLIRTLVIITAREINADVRVFARARYLQERAWLEEIGATQICTEEAETALGLAILLLREVGADEVHVREEISKLHDELGVRRSESEVYPG
jgi:CPA2 family monovalent cation:H+ antiporter-2